MAGKLRWTMGMLLLLIALPVLADGELAITMKETAFVKGGTIGLTEIATVQGDPTMVAKAESLDLGKAPAPGHSVTLTRQFVIFRLGQTGLKVGEYRLEMPAQVRVTTEGEWLTGERLRALIEEAVVPKIPAQWTAWKMKFGSGFNDRLVGKGKLSAVITKGSDELLPGTNLLQVTVNSDDQEQLHLAVAVRIDATGRVPVLKEDLQRHSLVQDAAWTWEERALNGRELMEVPMGKIRTTRRLRQGEVLAKGDVETVPLVEKGAKVLIVYRSNGAAVQTYGLARSDGWLGQTIPVENIDSKKVIVSVVTGEGQVEVK